MHPRPSLETEQKMIQFVPMASTVVLIAVSVFRSTATVRDPAICPPSACLERSLIRQMASDGFFFWGGGGVGEGREEEEVGPFGLTIDRLALRQTLDF